MISNVERLRHDCGTSNRKGDPVSDARGPGDEIDGVGLNEAIASVRADLLAARLDGADADIQLPVASLTIELTVVAMKGADGKAGVKFKVPLFEADLGGGATWKNEATQKVIVQFSEPVDRNGNPVKVASTGPAGTQRKG